MRSAFGRLTLSMPSKATPRRMNGATDAGKSMPWASPQAATAPRYCMAAQTLAKVWLPTESTAPAQRSLARGLPGSDRLARSMISLAPRRLR
ncbi:hypothetical protein D3C71_1872990 [compost metagenome]